MKNSFFTILLISIVSFSFSQDQDLKFSQDQDLKKQYAKAKFKTIEFVNQLDDVLRLNDKQKAIFTKHFSEYTHRVIITQEKFRTKIKSKVQDKIESKVKSKINKALNPINNKIKDFEMKKEMNVILMKHAKTRDLYITKHLKPKQVKKYQEFMSNVNPINLEVNKKKNRVKRRNK